MDLLFSHLLLWGRQEGYQWFNLGVAPLSDLQDQSLAELWRRIGTRIFRHGEHFASVAELRHFQEKFAPAWEARYLASTGGVHVPEVLADLAQLITGENGAIVSR